MSRRLSVLPLLAIILLVAPLAAQQVCPGMPYVANTPEDELMQAVNGADKPEDQIAALDKFSAAHPDSKFMPCVYEYYAMAYVKAGNFDQAIRKAEPGLNSDHVDMNLLINLAKAYVGSGTASDTAFQVIEKAPPLIKSENTPSRPTTMKDEDWAKTQQDAASLAHDETAYMEYAFFQLVPRVPDPAKQIADLDEFVKNYPDAEQHNAALLNNAYFSAYQMQNNLPKIVEFGEKVIASDPNNVHAYALLSYIYSIANKSDMAKAETYAKKAVELASNLKKPEGVSDEDFNKERDAQAGMAHLVLGYINFDHAGKVRSRIGPAIEELKLAEPLLASNPQLEAQTLFYLGNAYEFQSPPNHRAAAEALTKAAGIQSPFQEEAKALLAKVKAAR
jgi:tetratricopeptide (TPR) repeat protein